MSTETPVTSVNSRAPSAAVFVGGTSGIGQAMAEQFARDTAGNTRIIIMGRNKAAADSIISRFPAPTVSPAPKHEFVQCDVTLMKNIQETTTSLLQRIPKINYLVITTGVLTTSGRSETSEGIDKKLALNYYARWRLIKDLLPALEKAKQGGEDAKVMSVLGAGKGGPLDESDLGLKKNYSVSRAALQAPTYNDLMMEEFQYRHPSLTFMQCYPGFVRTPMASSSDSAIIRISGPLITGLVYPFTFSPAECAKYQLSALYTFGPGSWRTGSKGEDLKKKNYHGNEEQRKMLWEHTFKEVGCV